MLTKSVMSEYKYRKKNRRNKKIKKSLCPEFEYPLVKKPTKHARDELGLVESGPVGTTGSHAILPLKEDGEPKCDFCLMTSACNRRGIAEELLVCKDCHAKAHPSCMDYSEALAKRARNSPWQCIDCKTCCICEDSNDPDDGMMFMQDAMLFCDACDKGYHTSCHNPPVTEQPKGKWVCSNCVDELGINDSEDVMDTTEVEIKKENISVTETDGAAACLPTPSASPVQFSTDTDKKHVVKLNGSVAAPIPKLATTMKAEVPDASYWTIEDVVSYFIGMGFIDQAKVFREQEIDGKSLLLMKRNDVLTGLSLKLGPALKIYAHVQRLQTRGQIVF